MAKNATKTKNAPSILDEEAAPGTSLFEDVRVGTIEVIEEAAVDGKPKKVKVRGEFARCDEATANKRVYPKNLWERELKRLDKAIVERKVMGELDHPSDGRTSLNRVSHIVTGLHVDNGLVVGEAEILDTDAGRNLQALLKGGVKVGVSSRGFGTVKSNDKGEDVVQEDYKLVTFDFVADPADGKAYPDVFIEHKGQKMELKNMTPEALKAANPGLVEAISSEAVTAKELELAAKWAEKIEAEKTKVAEQTRASLKEEFSREVLAVVTKLKSDLTEEVRKDLLADPAIAGAKMALESVKTTLLPFVLPEETATLLKNQETEASTKIGALSAEVADLKLKLVGVQEENTKLTNVAKEVGYRFFLEKTLSGDSDAEMVRSLIGDVKTYANVAEIKAKLEAIKADLNKKRDEAKAKTDEAARKLREAEELKQAEEARLTAVIEAKVSKYENHIAKLEEALEKSLEANQLLSVKVHAEKKLTNNPRAAKIRSILEAGRPVSTEDVDAIVESARESVRDPDDLEQVRARVRTATRGGVSNRALDEETDTSSNRSGNGNYNNTGLPIDSLKALAGIPTKR